MKYVVLVRLLVQSSIYDKVMPKLKEAFRKYQSGDPFDEDVKMSAQTGPEQLEKIESYVKLQKKIQMQIS